MNAGKEGAKLTNFTAIKQVVMQESKRQKQVAAVIEQEMNDIFQRLGLAVLGGGMVSIASVKVTPDLHEARIYLSFFRVADAEAALKTIQDRGWEIKRELTARVRNQFRIMPVLQFYRDDTLEYVDKMEQIFKDIKKQDDEINRKD